MPVATPFKFLQPFPSEFTDRLTINKSYFSTDLIALLGYNGAVEHWWNLINLGFSASFANSSVNQGIPPTYVNNWHSNAANNDFRITESLNNYNEPKDRRPDSNAIYTLDSWRNTEYLTGSGRKYNETRLFQRILINGDEVCMHIVGSFNNTDYDRTPRQYYTEFSSSINNPWDSTLQGTYFGQPITWYLYSPVVGFGVQSLSLFAQNEWTY